MKQSPESAGNNINESRRGFLRDAGVLVSGALVGSNFPHSVSNPEKFILEQTPTTTEQASSDSWIVKNLESLLNQLTGSPEDILAVTEAKSDMATEASEYEEKIKKAEQIIAQNPSSSACWQTHVGKMIMWKSELEERERYINAYTQILLKISTMPARGRDQEEHIPSSTQQHQPKASLTTHSNKQIM